MYHGHKSTSVVLDVEEIDTGLIWETPTRWISFCDAVTPHKPAAENAPLRPEETLSTSWVTTSEKDAGRGDPAWTKWGVCTGVNLAQAYTITTWLLRLS